MNWMSLLLKSVELVKNDQLTPVVDHFGFKTLEDLIANVGYGKITPLQVVRRFTAKAESEEKRESVFNKLIGRVRKKKPKGGVVVKGVDDILIRFGKCCQPVPGERIMTPTPSRAADEVRSGAAAPRRGRQ